MPKEKCLFERLDDISADQSAILSTVTDVKKETHENSSEIAALREEIEKLKQERSVPQAQTREVKNQQTSQNLFMAFLKQSKKSWRWFGTLKEFKNRKALSIILLVVFLLVGLSASVISTLCFKMYSTFTFFENALMIIGIIFIVYSAKTKYIHEVNDLTKSTPYKYETDNIGMKFPRKERLVFRVFKWIAVISTACNVIFIWAGMGKDYKVVATILELVLLVVIIFAFFITPSLLFSNYSIIWIEGYNLTTKQKVTLVLPPGAKELITEEEFKKMMPFFYE